MKKTVLITACVALLMTSCANQFNQVYKSDNYNFKYEYAKECYATGKYSRAVTLLQELVTLKKGSTEAEECLYMLAMAEYGLRNSFGVFQEILSDLSKRHLCRECQILCRRESLQECARASP